MTRLSRRDFIKRGSLFVVGTAILPYEEILDRLTWTRTLFPSAAFTSTRTRILGYSLGFNVSQSMIEDDIYTADLIIDRPQGQVTMARHNVSAHSGGLVVDFPPEYQPILSPDDQVSVQLTRQGKVVQTGLVLIHTT